MLTGRRDVRVGDRYAIQGFLPLSAVARPLRTAASCHGGASTTRYAWPPLSGCFSDARHPGHVPISGPELRRDMRRPSRAGCPWRAVATIAETRTSRRLRKIGRGNPAVRGIAAIRTGQSRHLERSLRTWIFHGISGARSRV